jgi:hypothetical protein
VRPATTLRIVAAIGVAWALAAFTMLARGDPEGSRTLAQLFALAITVAGLTWAVHRFRIEPRRGSFDAQARHAGLRAEAGDPLGLMQMPFALFGRAASARDLENTAWGVRHEREIVVADYWFAPSSNPSLDDDYRRFNRAFDVRADDARFAAAFLDARMMDWLMGQAPGVGFEIVAGHLMLYEPRSVSSLDDVDRALRRFDGLFEHVPVVVASLYPAASASSAGAPHRPDL